MPQKLVDCLFSEIECTASTTKIYPFLPRGVKQRLAPGEKVQVAGNILDAVMRNQRVTDKRRLHDFIAAVQAGDLTIVSMPNPIVRDPATGDGKMLRLDASGTEWIVDDPCYASEDPSPDDTPPFN